MSEYEMLVKFMREFREGMELFAQRMQLDDNERLRIVNLHAPWEAGKSYGTNEYLKYGADKQGRVGLYRTTRNISNSTTPPDQPATPQQYVLVGYSTFI